jgi:hypothetical protein
MKGGAKGRAVVGLEAGAVLEMDLAVAAGEDRAAGFVEHGGGDIGVVGLHGFSLDRPGGKRNRAAQANSVLEPAPPKPAPSP